MKILAVADKESRYLWDYYEKGKLQGIELIVSCGDLDPNYLSFLATLSDVPVLYVRGNHDSRYAQKPPEGCICVENRVYVHKGIRIMGLGGSMRYNTGENQYTEKEMAARVRKMRLPLMRSRGVDILLTHSPAFGLNDGKDLPHRGFQVFHCLLERYQPRFFIHGHAHLNYDRSYRRHFLHGQTQVINAYERYLFDYEGTECPEGGSQILIQKGIGAEYEKI